MSMSSSSNARTVISFYWSTVMDGHPSKEGTVSTMGFRMEAPKLFVLPGDQPWTGSGFSIVSLKGISSVSDRVLNLSPICRPEQLLMLGTVHN